MSVRASAGFPSSCSGAMYCSVPRIVPRPVSEGLAFAAALILTTPPTAGRSFASPKSRSFVPTVVSMTLPGFKSRCVIP